MKKFTKNLLRHDVVPVACAVGLALFCCPPHPAFASQQRPGKVPVQARFRSDNYAAVLRLQKTQPKDRRIYTAFTGILAGPLLACKCRMGRAAEKGKADSTGHGNNIVQHKKNTQR